MIKAKNTSFQEERLPQQFLKKKKKGNTPLHVHAQIIVARTKNVQWQRELYIAKPRP